MFPCCNLCYIKYLIPKEELESADSLFSLETEIDEEVLSEHKVPKDYPREKLCKCPCHIKGLKVLH